MKPEQCTSLLSWGSTSTANVGLAGIFAECDPKANVVSVEDIVSRAKEKGMPWQRRQFTAALRELQHMGFGDLIPGRGKIGSRFVATVGIRDLGLAALGELTERTNDIADEGFAPQLAMKVGEVHRIVIRPGVTIQLPADLTRAEAARLSRIIENLPND